MRRRLLLAGGILLGLLLIALLALPFLIDVERYRQIIADQNLRR